MKFWVITLKNGCHGNHFWYISRQNFQITLSPLLREIWYLHHCEALCELYKNSHHDSHGNIFGKTFKSLYLHFHLTQVILVENP